MPKQPIKLRNDTSYEVTKDDSLHNSYAEAEAHLKSISKFTTASMTHTTKALLVELKAIKGFSSMDKLLSTLAKEALRNN